MFLWRAIRCFLCWLLAEALGGLFGSRCFFLLGRGLAGSRPVVLGAVQARPPGVCCLGRGVEVNHDTGFHACLQVGNHSGYRLVSSAFIVEEEEESLPALRETLWSRTKPSRVLDAKERLKTAVHTCIKQIRKYKDGLISHDELSPTPVR